MCRKIDRRQPPHSNTDTRTLVVRHSVFHLRCFNLMCLLFLLSCCVRRVFFLGMTGGRGNQSSDVMPFALDVSNMSPGKRERKGGRRTLS